MHGWLNRRFRREDPVGLLLLGLDSAGKTTLLYKLKKKHDVTATFPFIGLRIQEATAQQLRFKSWDLGGCARLPWAIMPQFWQGTEALVFCMDSNDLDRMNDARDQMAFYTSTPDLHHLPVLVFANKQDLPNAMTPQELEKALDLAKQCKGRPYRIEGCCFTSMDSVTTGLQWLRETVQENRRANRAYFVAPSVEESMTVKMAKEVYEAREKEKMLEGDGETVAHSEPIRECLEAAGAHDDISDEAFLEKFRTHSLDAWDHCTHLKIAWTMLRLHGHEKGAELVGAGIREYIEHSKGGRRFHATMTAFWVHMVAHALSERRVGDDSGDFGPFLRMNPALCDKNYPLQFYSPELLFRTDAARSEIVEPDLKPLPTLGPPQSH